MLQLRVAMSEWKTKTVSFKKEKENKGQFIFLPFD